MNKVKMEKIFYLNPNVGSGIEYAGNVFLTWLQDLPGKYDLINYKYQNPSYLIFKDIIKEMPDIIILNEYYIQNVRAVLHYKMINKNVKVLYILHVWKYLIDIMDNSFVGRNNSYVREISDHNHFLVNSVDDILVLNYKPDNIFPGIHNVRIKNGYMPTDPNVYKITCEWKKRKKKFMIAGNIIPLKISEEFIRKISETNIEADCFGDYNFDSPEQFGATDEYYKILLRSKNLKLFGLYPQERMAYLFNEYKYLIIPHDGYETFNFTLLQAICCGTVPLVINDRTTKAFDYTWIDWADQMYIGTNTVDSMIQILKKRNIDNNIDLTAFSKKISGKAYKKFNYIKLKSYFLSTLNAYNEQIL
jgi:hypothetical protein